MLIGHRTEIQEAMSSDFGVHPPLAADLIEVLGPAGRAAYAAEQLPTWMAEESRPTDPALYGSGRAFVQPQPKGVIGNIVPWNFPFDLSVGPLVEMLAAGNRVVIKPSEYTPACAELLREMVHATFDRDRVEVVVGGLDLARAFTGVRWDHLLYTGSPAIGREIAKAAAEQLVPVTLELGGKCPAIVAEDSVDAETLQAGARDEGDQERPDVHLGRLLPRAARAARGVRRARRRARARVDARLLPLVELHRDHLRRATWSGSQALLDEARARGCDVRMLEDAADVDPGERQLPIALVIDPPDDLALMREEIFGPILPIKAYDTLDEAIAYVNAGERPLALYVFAKDEAVAEDVLRRTTSGGACVNCAAVHGALPSLPFGGIGQSGSGRHHGIEGFREFSNLRAVFVRGEGDLIEAFAPPYGPDRPGGRRRGLRRGVGRGCAVGLGGVGCRPDGAGVELLHLQQRGHRAVAPRLVGIAHQLGEARGHDLPGQPVAVLQPAARPLLAAVRQLVPVVVDLVLVGAFDEERDRLVEAELRAAVDRGERLAVQHEFDREGHPCLARPSFAVVGDALDPRVREHRHVERGGLLALGVEPQVGDDLRHVAPL